MFFDENQIDILMLFCFHWGSLLIWYPRWYSSNVISLGPMFDHGNVRLISLHTNLSTGSKLNTCNIRYTNTYSSNVISFGPMFDHGNIRHYTPIIPLAQKIICVPSGRTISCAHRWLFKVLSGLILLEKSEVICFGPWCYYHLVPNLASVISKGSRHLLNSRLSH